MQRVLALQPHDLDGFVAQLGNAAHQRQAVGCAEHDHLAGRDAHDGGGPGGAAVGVGQHLRLVDDGDVDDPIGARHLHSAGDVAGAGHDVALLSGQQARHHAAGGQRFLELQGEQPQRSQRRAAVRRREPVERVVRRGSESAISRWLARKFTWVGRTHFLLRGGARPDALGISYWVPGW